MGMMILQYTASELGAIIYVVDVEEKSKFDVQEGSRGTCLAESFNSLLPAQMPKTSPDQASVCFGNSVSVSMCVFHCETEEASRADVA